MHKSSGGLKRDITKRHPSSKAQKTSSSDCLVLDLAPTAEMKLEPLILKGFLQEKYL